MNKGRIKWYNETKGFGFIETDQGRDIFVHRSGLSNPMIVLEEGQSVEFEVRDGQKGPMAVEVTLVD